MQTIISNYAELSNIKKSLTVEDGKKYYFLFEELKQAKTLKQLGFIFGGLVKALRGFYLDTDGTNYDADTIKELLYEEVGIDQILYLPTGKKIVSKKTLSKMNKEEASEFINQAINWIDENTECILPIGLRYLWTQHITDAEIDNMLSEPLPERDSWYLSKIRNMNCLVCGNPHSEAHHIKKGWHAKGIKPPDYMAIPLCKNCHIPIAHTKGEDTLIKMISNVLNGLDIGIFCRCLYLRSKQHL